MARGSDAQRQPERDADHERAERQLDGVGQHVRDLAPDRTMRNQRRTQVTLEHGRHEVDILDRQRLIEAEVVAHRGERLLARLIAEDDERRIAGCDADEEEHDRQHGQQRRHCYQQPLDDVGQHRRLVSLGSFPRKREPSDFVSNDTGSPRPRGRRYCRVLCSLMIGPSVSDASSL